MDKLITEMSVNIKAFNVMLQMQENQLKMKNVFHFLQLKSLKTFCPENIQESARRIFLLQEKFDE
jgi:hypothetical protein